MKNNKIISNDIFTKYIVGMCDLGMEATAILNLILSMNAPHKLIIFSPIRPKLLIQIFPSFFCFSRRLKPVIKYIVHRDFAFACQLVIPTNSLHIIL